MGQQYGVAYGVAVWSSSMGQQCGAAVWGSSVG